MTRVGQDSKVCFCGDINQSDLQKTNERNGILDFKADSREHGRVLYG